MEGTVGVSRDFKKKNKKKNIFCVFVFLRIKKVVNDTKQSLKRDGKDGICVIFYFEDVKERGKWWASINGRKKMVTRIQS